MKTLKTNTVLVAALCFGLAASASYAGGRHRQGKGPGHGPHRNHQGQRHHGSPLMMFDTLDLLQSETAPLNFTVENFPAADIDSNGTLDAEEWTTFATAKYNKLIEHVLHRHPEIDIDSDGVLDDGELAALKADMTERVSNKSIERKPDADIDSSGEISADEIEAVQAAKLAKFLERKPDADLNGDGTLSAEEFAAFRLVKSAKQSSQPGSRRPGGVGHKRGHRGKSCRNQVES